MSRLILPRRFRQGQGGFIMNPFANLGTGTFTFDPSAKGALVVLSSGNLIAEKTATSYQTGYTTSGKSSGKWQFEMKHLATTGANGPIIGIADKTNIGTLPGTYIGENGNTVQESIGWRVDGIVYRRLSTATSTVAYGTASALNDIITVTLDLSLGTPEVRWYKNGTALAAAVTLPTGKTWFPAVSVRTGSKVELLPTLTYPVSGFSDWS